jgi:hypothetical protein
MKIGKVLAVLLALVVFSNVGALRAQEEKKTTHMKTRTLRGCLQKGDDAKEYRLTATDGGKWDLKSDSVKFSPHVGHTVAVTGVVSHSKAHAAKEDAKDEAKEHGIATNSTETGALTVTNLKMVSPSCQE